MVYYSKLSCCLSSKIITFVVMNSNIETVKENFFNKHCEIMEFKSKIRNKRTEYNILLQRKFATERQLFRLLTVVCHLKDRADFANSVSYMYKVDELEREITQISETLSKFRKEEEEMRDKVVILEMESSTLVQNHLRESHLNSRTEN